MAAGIEDIPVRIIIDTDADGLEASPLNRDREQSSRGLQDIEDINTTPSQGAADAAQMALDWKEETGNPNDCGTQTGWTRASQLADRENLTEDTINRMVSFFARHESTQEPDEPKEDCSRMMWKAWGGDAGRSWAEDTQAQFDTAREAAEKRNHSHNDCALDLAAVVNDKWLGWEHDMYELQHGVAYGDADLTLNQIVDSAMPSFVKDRLRDAIMGDAFFSDFDAIDGEKLMQMRLFFEEQLEQDGWTTDMVAGRLQDLEPELTRSEAERIARTESQALINDAREEGYEQTGMLEDEKFYWVGSMDDRTTDACKWLIGGSSAADNIGGAFDGTNPNEGGNPVSLEELKELVQKAADKDPSINTDARQFTPHINCRKTYVRDV